MSYARTSGMLSHGGILFVAIQRDNFEVVKRLLDRIKVDGNCIDESGMSCLHWAIRKHDTRMLELLLEHNIDLNPKMSILRLPLSYAITLGRQKAAELLIRAGADVNAQYAGTTPLELTVKASDVYLTRLLLDHGAQVSISILETAYRNQSSVSVIKTLLDRVSTQSLNACTEGQISLLISALRIHHNEEAIELLNDYPQIKLLWDPAISNGMTTLHCTVMGHSGKDHASLVRVLMARGAEIDAVEADSGRTALHAALEEKKSNMARELINSGANVNAKIPFFGIFPLYLSAMLHSADTTELLISKGADLHATTSSLTGQRTALHKACDLRSEDNIRALLLNGADPLVRDVTGRTAFQLLNDLDGGAARQMVRRLAAIAVAEMRQLDDKDLELIRQTPRLLEYFDQCAAVIERMREVKVYHDLTLFRVHFGMSDSRLTKLVKNEDFVASLKSELSKGSFQIYEDFIYAKLKRAEEEMKSRRVIQEYLQDLFASFFPDPILDHLGDFLTISDISAFDSNSR